MKKFVGTILFSLTLFCSNTAYATTINVEIWGTALNSTAPTLISGNRYKLFDMTYDDSSESKYTYDREGNQLFEYNISGPFFGNTLAVYFSDAIVNYGSEIADLLTGHFSSPYPNEGYYNWAEESYRTESYVGSPAYHKEKYWSGSDHFGVWVTIDKTGQNEPIGEFWASEPDGLQISSSEFVDLDFFYTNSTPVPEPTSFTLFSIGVLGLSVISRKRI